MNKKLFQRLKEDFREFSLDCFGILLYGSYAKGEETKRSDIDICLVMPSEHVLNKVLSKLGGKYDIKVFEELPLYIRINIIKNHVKIYAKDELDLYFYSQMKIWKDMEHRIKENAFKSIEEKLTFRRRWLVEKKKILREA